MRETLFNMGWGTNEWEAEEWNRVKERVLEEEEEDRHGRSRNVAADDSP